MYKILDKIFLTLWLEMANKPVPVGIVRIRSRFDGESPH